MIVVIEKMDHLGRGICYIEGKVCFVPYTIPGDEVDITIIKDNKNYLEAEVEKVISSNDRTQAFCPYFGTCGGCELQYFSYDKTIKYKKDRIQNILNGFNIPEVEIIENKKDKNYRNKLTLKLKDGILGFYKDKSHSIIEIDSCPIASKAINSFFEDIKKMELLNADIVIRSNFNDELLISIDTEEVPILNEEDYPSKKVAGIVLNGMTVYGDSHFIDKVGSYFFDISFDSFFQVNSYINEKLFSLIQKHVQGKNVLDLYCGVGTLSIVASASAEKVWGIEIVPNAIINAIKNAKMNERNNISFMLGDVQNKIKFIEDKIDTIIVDPPRKGLDEYTLNKVKELLPKQIIYISCDTQSLKRDLTSLTELYDITYVYALDMFSYSYHTECVCVLSCKD